MNHSGTLTGGHYHCDIKQENIWIRYDDSYTTEYDKKIVTENAYLLIYKLSNENKNIYNEEIKNEFGKAKIKEPLENNIISNIFLITYMKIIKQIQIGY